MPEFIRIFFSKKFCFSFFPFQPVQANKKRENKRLKTIKHNSHQSGNEHRRRESLSDVTIVAFPTQLEGHHYLGIGIWMVGIG